MYGHSRTSHHLGERYRKWLSGEECTFRIVPKACHRHPGQDRNPEWYSLRMAMKPLIGPHAYLELSKPPNHSWRPTFLIQRTSEIDIPSSTAKTSSRSAEWLSDSDLQRLIEGALRCKERHKQCAGPIRTMNQTATLRFIDVRDRTIRESQTNDQYVTLSYRWGKSKRHTRLDISSTIPTISATNRNDRKFVRKLPDVLPQMIEDVIQVVQRLEQRFLWIDAYCIDQNDPAEVQATVT